MGAHLKRHLSALSQPRNPIRHPEAHLAAQDYLRRTLLEVGRQVDQETFETALGVRGINLMSGPEQAPILIVAHYDTVDHSPGADDNTSAVALALELASLHPEIAVLFPDLEERDLLGSRHFVQGQRWARAQTLVLESVGYWREEPRSQGYPPLLETAFPAQFAWLQENDFRGNFWAILALQSGGEAGRELASYLSSNCLEFPLPDRVAELKSGNPLSDFGRSDHLAFWEAGRPCLMLTDTANFRNPNYHEPSDTLETLSFGQMESLLDDLSRWCQALISR